LDCTFSAGVGTTNSFVAGLGIPAGSTYADDGRLCPANGLIQNIHMFDTTHDDNLLKILKLAKVR
jgi:hypothetical protein